jgi:two-component system sensor histidine kinase KdpD
VHGNIYPKERVQRALNSFFRIDNLTALRELALRFLADETDEDLLEHLRRHDSTAVWETCERVMVAVAPNPGTDSLLRRAARMAARLKGELDVVYVASSDATRSGDKKALTKLEQLTADVGARWYEIPGDDPARSIARFAQEHQITQIVIGSSQRSRWQQLLAGGSRVKRIIQEVGPLGIDVHVIALHKAPREGPTEETADPARRLVQVRTPEEADSVLDPEDQ